MNGMDMDFELAASGAMLLLLALIGDSPSTTP